MYLLTFDMKYLRSKQLSCVVLFVWRWYLTQQSFNKILPNEMVLI
jgi:hypothetical protein